MSDVTSRQVAAGAAELPYEPERMQEDSDLARSLSNPLSFLWRYVKLWPGHFIGLSTVVIGASLSGIASQYGMKLLVDAMEQGAAAANVAVWYALGFFVGLFALEAALWRVSGWLGCRTSVGVGVDIRLDLLNYATGHPMRFFQEQRAGTLGHRITATAGDFSAMINKLTWNVAPPVVNFLGAFAIFLTINVPMALALAAFAIVITSGLYFYSVRGRPLHRKYAELAGHTGGEMIDVLTNIWAVKAFAAGARERTRLRYTFDQEADAQRVSWMFTEKARVIHDVLLWTMAGSMLVWALLLWKAGSVSAGSVVVVSTLVFRILHGSRDLAVALVEIEQHVNYLGETLRLVGVPHEVTDRQDAASFARGPGAIRFENVTFGYSPGRPVLKDFSLDIPAGQKVGVVGPSGAGKSTIIHLVQRLHDIQSGRVLIDGQDARELTQESLRYAIAVVPQEISLFHRTVLENIRFGRPEANDQEVRDAAAAAHCGFIEDLPAGYQTIVGDRGAKLSGGQRQRVGIARAIVKDAPIVILDEATSALDTESEIEVQHALDRLTKDRTVIAVAHRLSTLSSFDRIVVLMDGRVAEDGSIDELLARDGVFARMWKLQIRGISIDVALEQQARGAI